MCTVPADIHWTLKSCWTPPHNRFIGPKATFASTYSRSLVPCEHSPGVPAHVTSKRGVLSFSKSIYIYWDAKRVEIWMNMSLNVKVGSCESQLKWKEENKNKNIASLVLCLAGGRFLGATLFIWKSRSSIKVEWNCYGYWENLKHVKWGCLRIWYTV